MPGHEDSKESMTKQSFKDECDINKIMEKYKRTGQVPLNIQQKQGQFLDVSSLPDYQNSLNIVIEAENMFNQLPSKVRARFKHDPSEMLNFVKNIENKDEAIALGLIPKPEPVEKPVNKNTDDAKS